jgi:hypothetical protein
VPLNTNPNADRNDCAHVAALGLRLSRVGLLLDLVDGAFGLGCGLLGLVLRLSCLVRRLTRILLRRAELGAQIVVCRLRGRDDVDAGLLSLIDLPLLRRDLGVGVVEVRVEVEGVDPEPDEAGGQEAGDGDPAPRPL